MILVSFITIPLIRYVCNVKVDTICTVQLIAQWYVLLMRQCVVTINAHSIPAMPLIHYYIMTHAPMYVHKALTQCIVTTHANHAWMDAPTAGMQPVVISAHNIGKLWLLMVWLVNVSQNVQIVNMEIAITHAKIVVTNVWHVLITILVHHVKHFKE